jgi:hypothetical protein
MLSPHVPKTTGEVAPGAIEKSDMRAAGGGVLVHRWDAGGLQMLELGS